MGKLFDDFGKLTYSNEAEVSQNFILPLLQRYLGYKTEEIIPEKYFPAKDVHSGVNFSKGGTKSLNHRPDYVICLNGDLTQPLFIIDSKGPEESIDLHRDQLKSYAISVKRNMLMITNGKELKVFNVNEELFYSVDISDLQIKINSFIHLLGRDNQSLKTTTEILKEYPLGTTIHSNGNTAYDRELRNRQVLLADFKDYLENTCREFENWHLPTQYFQALDNLELAKIDPNYLQSFQVWESYPNRRKEAEILKLHSVDINEKYKIKIFTGETGSGKTCLLKYMTYQNAQNCLCHRQLRIPVFISLREIGPQRKLEDLIIAVLNRHGYPCSSIYELPRKNEFVFYLDAFDEVLEIYQTETFHIIENLSLKYFFYITSRPNRLPSFKPSLTLELQPISEREIDHIVRQQLPDRHYEFQRQLEQSNLIDESGNILLLLSLISVFKESGTLPSTATKVIATIVERLKKWQDSKHQQASIISWQAIEAFLSSIGYVIMELGGTALPKPKAEEVLRYRLQEIEQLRQIPQGLTLSLVIEALTKTGLLMESNDQLFFWHRLFLNHFASLGLKSKYENNQELMVSLVCEPRWHIAILGLASLLSVSTELIIYCRENIWLCALCLAENSRCEDAVIGAVVDDLLKLASSPVPEIRARASRYLTKIDHNNVLLRLYEAIEQNISLEIKMYAISYVAKTRSARALSIIMENIDWDDHSIFTGVSSQANIVRALYYYNEPQHLQIVENWRKTNDYLMNIECGRIFTDLYNQGRLTANIIASLQNLFIDDLTTEKASIDKLEQQAKVLSLVSDDVFLKRVVDLLFIDDDPPRSSSIAKLLSGSLSSEVIAFIKTKILNESGHRYTIAYLAEIICNSRSLVPKEVYLELAEHNNLNVASHAIKALKRFSYEQVEDVVEKYLYGDQPQLQSAALNVLVKNGAIIELISSGNFPQPFYFPTAHTLLKAVRWYNLSDAIPIMDAVYHHLGNDNLYRSEFILALDLARTYYQIHEKEKYLDIIGWYYDGKKFIRRDEYLLLHLMKTLKYFDLTLAISLAEAFFETYFPFKEEGQYNMEVFLETVEELGQYALVKQVKQIVESLLNELTAAADSSTRFRLERPMRTLASLVEPSDEQWILDRLDSMKADDGFYFPQLRRAVECLAYAGSLISLPYIRQIAHQFKGKELVINTCQMAYEQICKRERIVVNGDLFDIPFPNSTS